MKQFMFIALLSSLMMHNIYANEPESIIIAKAQAAGVVSTLLNLSTFIWSGAMVGGAPGALGGVLLGTLTEGAYMLNANAKGLVLHTWDDFDREFAYAKRLTLGTICMISGSAAMIYGLSNS